MPRRHDIEAHLQALEDIGKIMRSMKNLSYLETRKLTRFLVSQRRVVAGIEEAALDFLAQGPPLVQAAPGTGTLYLLIGAERGFCGSFNESLHHALNREVHQTPLREAPPVVAVGSRLATLLAGDTRLVVSIPGASAAEQVPGVLGQLVPALNRLTTELGVGALDVIHWDPETDLVTCDRLLPPFRALPQAARPAHAFPPRLNLAPEAFLKALIQHYLFSALHALLFGSLMAEHMQRVRHLDRALGRVDSRVGELRQRRNMLRQEEITEEIELILLNVPQPDRPPS